MACGPAVTASEHRALHAVKAGLIGLEGDDHWYLLTNLMFSVTHQLQSDEIDMVAIGPPGVRVVEVKHWGDRHAPLAEHEADRVTMKARKVGTTLRRNVPHLPHVEGAVLLTRPPSQAKRLTGGGKVRGVEFRSLKDWRKIIRPGAPPTLAPREAKRLARALAPRRSVSIDGALPLRRLAGYVNLELQPGQNDAFHRIYKGVHSSRKDRVFLHMYDMSALSGASAERQARREHDVLHHRLSRFRWAPRILDSFQDVPGYVGEMKFFTVADPAVPSIAERRDDDLWELMQRLDFARRTVRAVKELHRSTTDGTTDGLGLVHRNISPSTILVKHDNSPVLTGFDHVGTPAALSTSLAGQAVGDHEFAVAPEVRRHGLTAADQSSDVYSLCASLRTLFAGYDGNDGWQVSEAVSALESGLGAPEDRPSPEDIERSFASFLEQKAAKAPVPTARYWTEGQEVPFQNNMYRVVARLGSGGVGTAFKVVQLSPSTKREVGTYVGKVVRDEATGEQVHRAYRRARQFVSRHPGLSVVFEVAPGWRKNEFVALTGWIGGTALAEYASVVPQLAAAEGREPEELVLAWLKEMCEALDVLHRNGLVHGDVSPRNIIVSESDAGSATRSLVLTDYDFVTRIRESPVAPGTMLYGSPNRVRRAGARPSDDLFALAASLFHVLFDKEPFVHDGRQEKERGLNWRHGDRAAYPRVADFLDRATDPDASRRFASGTEAQASPPLEDEIDSALPPSPLATRPPPLPPAKRIAVGSSDEDPWLRSLLQLIPVHLHDRSGKVFYSGLDAFRRLSPSPLYVLGLHPGGSPERMVRYTIGNDIKWHRGSVPRNWSAFRDEEWGRPAGTAPMQKRMLHMFAKLGMDPGRVPSSNLVFARARGAVDLGEGEFERLAAECWPFHRAVVENLGVRVVACLGIKTGRYVSDRLAVRGMADYFIEENDRNWASRAYRDGSGVAVVALTHPSRANWCNPLTDPTVLIERMLG